MPTKYENLAPYLQANPPPVFTNTTTSIGYTYVYRAPTAILLANIPNLNGVDAETWDDTRFVTSVSAIEKINGSDFGEMTVSTVYSYSGGGGATSSTPISTSYAIHREGHQLPLIQHPQFQKGGEFDLWRKDDATGRTGMMDVQGWQQTVSITRRFAAKYIELKDEGTLNTEITITNRAALAYVELALQAGELFTVYFPVWTKTSIYRGDQVPGTSEDTAGRATKTPSGTGWPTASPSGKPYEWIKTQDDASRVGNLPRWQRTESWTAYSRVYFDAEKLFPFDDPDHHMTF